MQGTAIATPEAVSVEPVAPVEADRFHAVPVLTVVSAHAVHDTYTSFLSPLLPRFIEMLSLSNTQAGLLTVFTQVPSLLQPVIGHLADRRNLRLLVVLAPAITGVAMSLTGSAPGYLVLAALLLMVGSASAGLHAVGPVLVGRQSGAHLGRGMSLWMVAGEVGWTLGPLLIVSVVDTQGMASTRWLMIFGLLASALLYANLRNMPTTIPAANRSGSATATPMREVLRRMGPFLVPLAAILASRAMLTAATSTFLPTFLTGEGASLWIAGASLSILQAAGVVGALVSGPISDRIGRRPVLTMAMVGAPLLLFVFLTIGGGARLVLLVLMGFVILSATPVVMALVQENFPENRSLANGIYMMFNFLIQSGAVIMLGALADGMGMRSAFWVSGGLALLGVPFIGRLSRFESAPDRP